LLFRVHVLTLPQIPEDPSDDLTDWFSESSSAFNFLKDALQSFHSRRIERLNSMQRKSKDLLWWPFTQHNLVPQESVTVIDSRCAENFSVYKVCPLSSSAPLSSLFLQKKFVMKFWLCNKVGWSSDHYINSLNLWCRLKTKCSSLNLMHAQVGGLKGLILTCRFSPHISGICDLFCYKNSLLHFFIGKVV